MQQKYFKFTAESLQDNDGKINSLVIVAVDVTENVQTRKKIEENEKRFRLLADFMPQKIWMTDDKRKLTYQNRQYLDFTGLTLEQFKEAGWEGTLIAIIVLFFKIMSP